MPDNPVQLTVEDILARLKAKYGEKEWAIKAGAYSAIINQYGPALVKMGADGTMEWLQNLFKTGDEYAAFQAVCKALPDGDAINAAWDNLHNELVPLNAENAKRVAWPSEVIKAIGGGIMKILVDGALVAVGL